MFKRSAIAAALALSAFAASAGLSVDPVDVAANPTPANFDFASLVGDTFDLGTLSTDIGGTVTYSFIGAEAWFTNQFMGAGAATITNAGGADIVDIVAGPGALLFSFVTVAPAEAVTPPVTNGMTFTLASNPSFAIFRGAEGSGYEYVIGFNDIGADNDTDYDDLLIGVNFTPVPEPGTYALLLAGLAAVGFVARRRAS